MMHPAIVIIIATAGLLSCKPGQKSAPDTVGKETINSVRTYVYTDPMGKPLILKNSPPKGETYTAPDGKKYFKVIFWTRMINETDTPLAFRIDVPAVPFELPSSPGKYYQMLVPPDTMTHGKEPLYNYGMAGLNSFLDSSIHKSSSIKRTINPKDSTGFYVVLLRLHDTDGPSGILRTGLSLNGQELIYRISRYDNTPAHALIDEKELTCGSIDLNHLVLRK